MSFSIIRAGLCIVLGLALQFGQAFGATGRTFYVDPAGNDANSGLSPVIPWRTIARVNANAFTPGDSILLKRGGIWHEQLTIPSSGSAASKLIFGAYGVGNNPLLKGSMVLTNANFSPFPITNIPIYSQVPTTNAADGAIRNYIQIITGITEAASQIKIRLTAADSADWVIGGVSIGQQSSGNQAVSLTRITWENGRTGTTISRGTYKISDSIPFNVSPGNSYLVHIWVKSRGYKQGTVAGAGAIYYDANTANETMIVSPGNSQLNTYLANTELVTAIIKSSETIWKTPCTANPIEVWENGQFLKNQISVNDNSMGSWFWDGSYLYINPSDNSNITTNGKLYEVCNPNIKYSIFDNGHSYLDISNIDCTMTYGSTDVSAMSGIDITGTGTAVHDLTSWNHRRHCFSFCIGSKGCLAYNLNVYNCESTTPIAIYGGSIRGATIDNVLRNCNVHQTNPNCNKDGCIVVHGMAANNTIEFNDIHIDSSPLVIQAINLYNAGTDSNHIQFNYIHGLANFAIWSQTSNTYVIGNQIEVSTNHGVYFYGATSGWCFNNTIIVNNTTGYPIIISGCPNVVVKNNICYAPNAIKFVDTGSQTGFIADNNCYYSASGPAVNFYYNGARINFSQWQARGFDTHGLNNNPRFYAAPMSYSLAANSPCIGAGATLTTATLLATSTVFPSRVALVPQSSSWTIGAWTNHK